MSRFSGSVSWLGRTCTNSSIHIQIFSLVFKMDSPCLLGMCSFIRWLETDCKFLRVVALWEGQPFWSKLLQNPLWSKPNPFKGSGRSEPSYTESSLSTSFPSVPYQNLDWGMPPNILGKRPGFFLGFFFRWHILAQNQRHHLQGSEHKEMGTSYSYISERWWQ